jgi:hypothetical protein
VFRHLSSVGPVESFDLGVLSGLSGLNVIEVDDLGLRPLVQGIGVHLRAVVRGKLTAAHLAPRRIRGMHV